MSAENRIVHEIPTQLTQLARLIVRGFYSIEDVLIIDMLCRNPCMKEDDICELLKFEKKMLRARMSTLKNDKFLQVRLKMETGADGKAQKVNYYFINYKTFVNVVKYKLDIMRKRLETTERDATSRASFKCTNCLKTFTDLEADQLFDCITEEFRCTYCQELVEEDQSALPKKDSRLLLAKFNDQFELLYKLLKEVEGITLAPELLEPNPVDIDTILGRIDARRANRPANEQWSGEATRNSGFMVEETRVDVTIGEETPDVSANNRKEAPSWMTQSTVVSNDFMQSATANDQDNELETAATNAANSNPTNNKQGEDIMSVLLAHERKGGANAEAVKSVLAHESSDSSDNEDAGDMQTVETGEVEVMESDEEDMVPIVMVNNRSIPITEVNNDIIAEMTPQEKDAYIQIYQEYYSPMYE